MLIKNYQAETVARALRMAREELGPDAVVLKTTSIAPEGPRRGVRTRQFQVTACVDDGVAAAYDTQNQTPAGRSSAISAELYGMISDLRRDVRYLVNVGRMFGAGQRISPEMLPHYCHLTAQEVDPALARNIVSRVEEDGIDAADDAAVRNALLSAIREKLPGCSEIGLSAGKSTRVVFIGPPGSGKSALVAKLAFRFAVEKKAPVTLVSVDDFKPTAARELETYGEILKVPCVGGGSVPGRQGKSGVILIDTAGVPVNAGEDIELLKAELSRLRPDEVHLVLPAYCRWDDMRKWCDFFRSAGPTHVALTFMDQTAVYGPAVNLALMMRMSLSYFSKGRTSAADLEPADVCRLAERILDMKGGAE